MVSVLVVELLVADKVGHCDTLDSYGRPDGHIDFWTLCAELAFQFKLVDRVQETVLG